MKQELAFHRSNPEFLLCLLLLCCLLFSCTTPEAQAVRQIALAGGIGYLEGGKVGAIAGAANAARRLTSAKNPTAKRITP